MRSPVGLTVRGCGTAAAAVVFVCTLAALPASASARQASHAVPASDGSIKLHGHWVIEVQDPDGRTVDRREFDNALMPGGAAHLAGVLGRQAKPGWWTVGLTSAAATGPCAGMSFSSVLSDTCWIVTASASGSPFLSPSAFPTLTQSLGGAANNQVVLAGNFTVRTAGQIDRVQTLQPVCGSTSPSCGLITVAVPTFSSHDLRDAQGTSAPIAVVPGQIVQVTVTFSFCGSEGCQS